MMVDAGFQAAGVIALAAAFGQVIARRLPIPMPALLLGVGVILGQDGLGWVRPDDIPDLVTVVVSLSVALIVFEGGLGLNWRMVRVLGPAVRNLVVGGLILTPLVGAVAVHYWLGFGWRLAALFGALVCVTGPSVISPLLRTVRVNDRLRAILMGEGIIIDPFGALLTLFLLQLAVAESFQPTGPLWWVVERVVAGVVIGGVGAGFVALFPRIVKRLSGRELALVVTASALGAFVIAEQIAGESGLTVMVVMGIAVGNVTLPHRDAIDEFQESIVAFLVASVYILLAAGVSVRAVLDLWPNGVLVVAALALVGRPLLVALSTWGSDVSWRERAFLSAVAPRGVVAASLAEVVAVSAGPRLGTNETQFVAMVFVVIVLTITVQSAYAPFLARWLRVYPMSTVIAGAGEVGRRAAAKLRAAGEPVLFIEANDEAAVAAREEGFEVLLGDITKLDVLRKADIENARAVLLTTPDDERNLLAASLVKSNFRCENIYARVTEAQNVAAFESLGVSVVNPAEAIASDFANLLQEPALTDILAPADSIEIARFTVTNPAVQRRLDTIAALRGTLVVLIRRRGESVIPNGSTRLELSDVVTIFGEAEALERARRALSLS